MRSSVVARSRLGDSLLHYLAMLNSWQTSEGVATILVFELLKSIVRRTTIIDELGLLHEPNSNHFSGSASIGGRWSGAKPAWGADGVRENEGRRLVEPTIRM
jgi:hypothetical protein